VQLRNDASGYGAITKALHWLTFALLLVQFTIGYFVEDESGRGRGRGRSGESGRGRGRGGDDDFTFGFGEGDDRLLSIHVILGTTILVVTVFRFIWRRTTPLPAWASSLSHRERTLAHWTELALYASLIAMPLTGLSLIFISDDLLGLHIASHIVLYIAFLLHVGLVLKHQLIKRDRLIQRML